MVQCHNNVGMAGKIIPVVLMIALAAAPSRADPLTQVHGEYEIYAGGLNVAELQAGFGLGPWNYQTEMTYHTTGLVGLLFRGHQLSTVQGLWQGLRAQPIRFY